MLDGLLDGWLWLEGGIIQALHECYFWINLVVDLHDFSSVLYFSRIIAGGSPSVLDEWMVDMGKCLVLRCSRIPRKVK